MGRNKVALICGILILLSSLGLSAQQNRYIIHFPDKSDNPYSISDPSEFLSQKAIDRRTNQNISISEEDFPVSPKYLDSLAKYGLKIHFTSKWLNCGLVQTTEEKINEIGSRSFVKSVEYVAPGAKISDEPKVFDRDYISKEPGSITQTSEQQLGMLHAVTMHRAGYTGAGLWIAVLDGGFYGVDSSLVFNHLYQGNKIRDKMDYTTGGTDVFQHDDHGTNVLSCIASNYQDILVGTGYEADFSLYVTEEPAPDQEYRVEEYNWLFAAERADSSGVDIISSSVGYNTFEDSSMDYKLEDLDGKTAVVTKAANLAFSKGILVVISAGNSGNSSSWDGKINFPADGTNVLAVGAVDDKNEVIGFSSKGPTVDGRIKPDLVAKGVRTTVLHGNGNIGFNNGTSFAAPLIAGFAAAVWQYKPDLTNLELLELLRSAGDNFDEPDFERGYGLPTFSRVTGDILAVDQVLLDKITVFPNPFKNNTIHIKIPDNFNSKSIEFLIHNTKGKLVGKKRVNKPVSNEIIDVNLKSKTDGLYFLTINTGDFMKKVKLIKY